MRTHLKLSSYPLLEGYPYEAECGKAIQNSHLGFEWDTSSEEITGINTLAFCSVCIRNAFSNAKGFRYIYGISEAEELLNPA